MLTNKRRSIVIYVSLALAVLIARELDIVDLNWYKRSFSTSTNSSWMCTTFSLKANTSIPSPSDQLTNPPIKIFFNEETLYQDERLKNIADNAIVIDIKEMDYDFLWVPFFKSSPYSATAKVHYGNDDEGGTKAHTGTLNLNGNISIVGPCSHTNAVKEVQQQIIKSMMEETTKHFQANR